MKPIGYFSELLMANSEEHWGRIFMKTAQKEGFDFAFLALVPRHGMQLLEDAYVKSNYDPEWRRKYDQNNLANIDPTVSHCVMHTAPIMWSPELFCTREQKRLYEAASSHGLRSGICLPIHGPRGEVGLLSFINDEPPEAALQRKIVRHLPRLSLLRDIVFETAVEYASRVNPYKQPPPLTRRELECLIWSAAGKSSWDIAKIIGRSESVVNYHFANIRLKFNVSTRREAVAKAVSLGLLDNMASYGAGASSSSLAR